MIADKYSYPETSGGWVKYARNPVLGDSNMGTCFDAFVIRAGDEFHMHFSWRPKSALAVCRGSDGVHWSAPEITLAPDPDSGWEDRLNRNCVIRKDDVWHMWYTGQAREHSWIGYAVSRDGLAYERASKQPVLFSERPYEGASVMNPFVMWDSERELYGMWYAAGETYEPNVIAYAESKDGMRWDKLNANPIFTRRASNRFEKERVGACHIVKYKGYYYMFYIGYEDISTARICVARSADGITNWRRSNPIISPSPGGWDADACYRPSVVCDEPNKRWLMWYNGRNGRDERIGLALREGLDLGFDA